MAKLSDEDILVEMRARQMLWETLFAMAIVQIATITREPQLFLSHLFDNVEQMLRLTRAINTPEARSDVGGKEFDVAEAQLRDFKAMVERYLKQTIGPAGSA